MSSRTTRWTRATFALYSWGNQGLAFEDVTVTSLEPTRWWTRTR